MTASPPKVLPKQRAPQFDRLSQSVLESVAVAIGAVLKPGDTLLLDGNLGAGKTTFARALIQSQLAAFGQWEDVPSPSFTLVQHYALDTVELWHVDLYRLSHSDEIYELGLIEAFETAICLIEWPDRLGDLVPESAICLSLVDAGEGVRNLGISANARRDIIDAATSAVCNDD